jgi:hypothetical protein
MIEVIKEVGFEFIVVTLFAVVALFVVSVTRDVGALVSVIAEIVVSVTESIVVSVTESIVVSVMYCIVVSVTKS